MDSVMILSPAINEQSVALRRVNVSDEQFLFQVYAGTRQEELAQVGWSESQKHSFLEMQFQAQRRYYESEYPGAEFQVILAGGQPVGRLYVHRREKEIRIMDLALLPSHRRQGMGTKLLKEILAEGEKSGRRVTIHVEIFNPALRLYEVLGFRQIASNGVYHFLEWKPDNSQIPPQSIPTPHQ
jgi:ribosomal protein S18 acetylase RimI-like enzyme